MKQKQELIHTPLDKLFILIHEAHDLANSTEYQEIIDNCKRKSYFKLDDDINICFFNNNHNTNLGWYHSQYEIIILRPDKLILVQNLTSGPIIEVYKLFSEIECNKNNYSDMENFNFKNVDKILLIDEGLNLRKKTIFQLLQNKSSKNARNI